MIIAFDYHGTYSRDPVSFCRVVALLKDAGHTCVLVTGIEDNDDFYAREVKKEIGSTMPIYFTAGAWKRRYMQAIGVHVDIWIEDTPECVAEIESESIRAVREQRTTIAIEAVSRHTTRR